MYKQASDKRQAALSRGRLADWVDGEQPEVDTRSVYQQWRDLKTAIKSLEARIQEIPKGLTGGRERNELGRRLRALQDQLPALTKQVRAEKLKKRDIAEYFMQIAREQLYPAQFKTMFAAALRLKEQDSARAEARIAEAKKDDPDAEQLIAEAEGLTAEAERTSVEAKANKLAARAARRAHRKQKREQQQQRAQQRSGRANRGDQP